jgi:hypothetical protein
MKRVSLSLLLTAAALTLTTGGLQAAFVDGRFAPGGTSVRVTPNEILFYNLGVPPLVQPTGMFKVLVPATGDFAPFVGQNGQITDLTRISPDPGCPGCAFAPTDTPLMIANFITIPNPGAVITITLTGIAAAIDTPGTPICTSLTPAQLNAAGTQCTPDASSPFLLQNVLDTTSGNINTSVNFAGSGLSAFVATPTQLSPTTINFGTSFTAQTIGQTLTLLATQGFVESSLQGDIRATATVIPEPATFALAGAVLIGLGFLTRRKAMR